MIEKIENPVSVFFGHRPERKFGSHNFRPLPLMVRTDENRTAGYFMDIHTIQEMLCYSEHTSPYRVAKSLPASRKRRIPGLSQTGRALLAVNIDDLDVFFDKAVGGRALLKSWFVWSRQEFYAAVKDAEPVVEEEPPTPPRRVDPVARSEPEPDPSPQPEPEAVVGLSEEDVRRIVREELSGFESRLTKVEAKLLRMLLERP